MTIECLTRNGKNKIVLSREMIDVKASRTSTSFDLELVIIPLVVISPRRSSWITVLGSLQRGGRPICSVMVGETMARSVVRLTMIRPNWVFGGS
jgi:hypothetical protein